ncbi:MAG TPA: hypothetical protein VF570_12885 [Pyrinomonadaceae bacterium]
MSSAKRKAEKRKARRTAQVVCRDGKSFWTTQAQFWQWVRDGVVVKTGDKPLAGGFVHEAEELNVILGNTVLNLSRPNHLCEALLSRRLGLAAK